MHPDGIARGSIEDQVPNTEWWLFGLISYIVIHENGAVSDSSPFSNGSFHTTSLKKPFGQLPIQRDSEFGPGG
jgi:hypothetical protein